MANTYSKLLIHVVFAVKNRENNLSTIHLPRIYAYMAETLRNLGYFPIIIGGIQNHIHLLVDMKPNQLLADMVKELKVASTKFINANHLSPCKFAWQRGYSAFSHSASQKEMVISYIANQFEHHKNRTMNDEIRVLYEKYGIEFDDRYLFEE